MSVSAAALEVLHEEVGSARPVVHGAFGLLGTVHRLGSARVSDLQRASGLPRTTVHRLLRQLEDVGAVEPAAGRWRLGPAVVELGAGAPACPGLRSAARRALMDLANATGELVALVVESAGQLIVIEVLAGTRRLAFEPEPGLVLDQRALAPTRACGQARRGDLRALVDVGAVDRRVSSVAAPLRLSPRDIAIVWVIVPGTAGVPAPLVEAARRTAARIASQLPPGLR